MRFSKHSSQGRCVATTEQLLPWSGSWCPKFSRPWWEMLGSLAARAGGMEGAGCLHRRGWKPGLSSQETEERMMLPKAL